MVSGWHTGAVLARTGAHERASRLLLCHTCDISDQYGNHQMTVGIFQFAHIRAFSELYTAEEMAKRRYDGMLVHMP